MGYLRDPETLTVDSDRRQSRMSPPHSPDHDRGSAAQHAAMAAWAEIERLRARSNEIEAMEPIPDDITTDALWAAE